MSILFCIIEKIKGKDMKLVRKMINKFNEHFGFSIFEEKKEKRPEIKIEYTRELYTLEKADKEMNIDLGPKAKLLTFNPWENFKSKINEGDEIYKFRSDTKSWKHLAGREGFELVRNGEVIYSITTEMS